MPGPPRLSKSRFVAGVQCQKLLWWTVHEPDAPELQPDTTLQDRLDQGAMVGQLARGRFPGGVLIDLPVHAAARVRATRDAITAGAPAVFEATFSEEGVYVMVDVLLRHGDDWTLIEVKSSSRLKPEHVLDAAVQTHVARRAGIPVRRVEIMHLDPDYRHPDQGDLFRRTDVTEEVEGFLPQVPALIREFLETLAGPLPAVPVGLHCWEPRQCPFFDRCWPADRDHVRRLYRARKTHTLSRMRRGMHRLSDLPDHEPLSDIQRRQIAAVQADRLIVAPGLARALDVFHADRLGYLDFETIQRAVPAWHGLGPWQPVVVQFSYHETDGPSFRHQAFLAEGPEDPRTELVERLLDATSRADRIVMYSRFERDRIRDLVQQVPRYAGELMGLAEKVVDLLPVIQNHVYHPDFGGSFSLKHVLPSLVPSLSYQDLVIVDGQVASVEIARLLFVVQKVAERAQLRRDLLAYCERDTWALVELLRRLRELAG